MATQRVLKSRWQGSPGKEIQDKIISLGIIHPGHGHNADELYQLLNNLPFREEILNGRDFRGMNIAARELDLSHCNFGYARVAYFYFCRLDHSVFDSCVAERATFDSSLVSCSFARARLRSCYFNSSNAKNCDFSKARLVGCSFQDADLRGSRFCDADCRGCTFAGANLVGCDFRGANLDEAVFCDVTLDKSTDFRGAKLLSIITRDWRDTKGNLIRKGSDLSQATT